MFKDPQVWAAIRRAVLVDGVGKRQICRQTGISRSTLVLLCPSCPLIKASRWQAFTLSPVIQACLLVATQTSVHPPTHPRRTMIPQPSHQQARQ